MADQNRIAMLFPGQGVQRIGMGREFYETSAVARATFDRATELLDYDLTALCFEGPAERLTKTEYCQPAVLTSCVAAWRAAEEAGFRGDIALGHSLGEYSALVASGTLDFDAALRLVVERAIVTTEVARNQPGRMAAVLGGSQEDVERLCREAGEVWPANYNCPGQIVVSGLHAGVERLVERASAEGIKTRMLDIDGAFHSDVMEPATARFRTALADVTFTPSLRPFLSATTVAMEQGERVRELLAQQLTAPVRFTQTVGAALELGVELFVEFGPRAVLAGLIRRIAPDAQTISVRTPGDLAALEAA